MFRIDSAGAVASPPATEAEGGVVGYFTEGNPATSTPATVFSADWGNTIQEELIALLTAAGVTPSKTDRDQVLESIRWLIENDKAVADFVVANNASAQNVTGLIFDKTIYKSAAIEFDLYRKTDAPTELSSVVKLTAIYKPVANTWTMLQSSEGDDCEVTFSIDSSGQVKYTSSNLAGANYAGSIRSMKVRRFKI